MSQMNERNLEFETKLRKTIGRDLETHESGDVYRGPILRVDIREQEAHDGATYKTFSIYLGWAAVREENGWVLLKEPEDGKEEVGVSSIGGNFQYLILDRDYQGRENISLPYLNTSFIYPAGDNIKKPER